jgi:hypothetical protein
MISQSICDLVGQWSFLGVLLLNIRGLWYARADSNGRPFAPEAMRPSLTD